MKNDCECNCNETVVDHEQGKLNCSMCDMEGKSVPFITVKTLIKPELRKKLKEEKYFICMNPGCDTVYFNKDEEISYSVSNMRKTIWFKTGSEPKIACYCNNITYTQVRKAVKGHDLKSWKNIVLNYRKKAFCNCEKLNPAGECCAENFYKQINKSLIESGKPVVNKPESCCE